MAAIGETNYTTAGKVPVKFENTPLPAGEWDLKLRTKEASVERRDGDPTAFPYVSLTAEVLNSASQEGGKNRSLYLNLFLKLAPGRDGKAMPDRADQLNGMAKALGEEYSGPAHVQADAQGNQVPYLDPQSVVKWLQRFDGCIVRARTRVKPAKDGWDAKAVISYFVIPEEMTLGGGNGKAGKDLFAVR